MNEFQGEKPKKSETLAPDSMKTHRRVRSNDFDLKQFSPDQGGGNAKKHGWKKGNHKRSDVGNFFRAGEAETNEPEVSFETKTVGMEVNTVLDKIKNKENSKKLIIENIEDVTGTSSNMGNGFLSFSFKPKLFSKTLTNNLFDLRSSCCFDNKSEKKDTEKAAKLMASSLSPSELNKWNPDGMFVPEEEEEYRSKNVEKVEENILRRYSKESSILNTKVNTNPNGKRKTLTNDRLKLKNAAEILLKASQAESSRYSEATDREIGQLINPKRKKMVMKPKEPEMDAEDKEKASDWHLIWKTYMMERENSGKTCASSLSFPKKEKVQEKVPKNAEEYGEQRHRKGNDVFDAKKQQKNRFFIKQNEELTQRMKKFFEFIEKKDKNKEAQTRGKYEEILYYGKEGPGGHRHLIKKNGYANSQVLTPTSTNEASKHYMIQPNSYKLSATQFKECERNLNFKVNPFADDNEKNDSLKELESSLQDTNSVQNETAPSGRLISKEESEKRIDEVELAVNRLKGKMVRIEDQNKLLLDQIRFLRSEKKVILKESETKFNELHAKFKKQELILEKFVKIFGRFLSGNDLGDLDKAQS